MVPDDERLGSFYIFNTPAEIDHSQKLALEYLIIPVE
jgi:hypothetical protein